MDKITTPVAIVTASIILGSAFYFVQINKQASIERQQEIQLEYQIRQNNFEREERESTELNQQTMSLNSQKMLEDCLKNVTEWEEGVLEAACPGAGTAVVGETLNCAEDIDILQIFDFVEIEGGKRRNECTEKF